MWSRLDTERKHWSLAAGDQLLPGRRTSHGGRKTHLQPPLLRAASDNEEETERRKEEIRVREREQGRKGGTGEEVATEKLMKGMRKERRKRERRDEDRKMHSGSSGSVARWRREG